MDVIWDYLSKFKNLSGNFKFPRLSKVAKLVFTIPHSNVDAKRVFSMTNKKKVKTRADLALEETLSSIVTCKVNNFFEELCYEFKPSKEMLQKTNKSTWVYNKANTNRVLHCCPIQRLWNGELESKLVTSICLHSCLLI